MDWSNYPINYLSDYESKSNNIRGKWTKLDQSTHMFYVLNIVMLSVCLTAKPGFGDFMFKFKVDKPQDKNNFF